MNKLCKICREIKDPSLFFKNKQNASGLMHMCKQCDNMRRYANSRKKNKERGCRDVIPTLVSRGLKEQGLKWCPKCKEAKPSESFYRSATSNSGTSAHCAICMTDIARERGTRPEIKEERHDIYIRDKDKQRNNHLINKYGITLEEYRTMSEAQNDSCFICGKKETSKALAVDHCHRTGKIRSLLCGKCNPAVGFLSDDPDLAQKVLNYIKSHV